MLSKIKLAAPLDLARAHDDDEENNHDKD